MAAVPVILNGVMLPKGKGAGDKPVPAVFCGMLSIQGLEVGGGPIIPDNPPPTDAHPEHPIVLPDPPVVDPPPTDPGPTAVIILKPSPPTGGWGLATDKSGALQWYFVPGAAGPKK